jgi:uncharacterized protein YukE
MSGMNLEVDPGDLQEIAGVLDTAGSSLFARASDLQSTPDAGASSHEVADALTGLASAVAALAQHIGSIAESTGAVSADFTGTDQAVQGAMQQRQSVLGP